MYRVLGVIGVVYIYNIYIILLRSYVYNFLCIPMIPVFVFDDTRKGHSANAAVVRVLSRVPLT